MRRWCWSTPARTWRWSSGPRRCDWACCWGCWARCSRRGASLPAPGWPRCRWRWRCSRPRSPCWAWYSRPVRCSWPSCGCSGYRSCWPARSCSRCWPSPRPSFWAEEGGPVSEGMYVQLLDLACGVFLLAAVLVLWRRRLAAIVRLFAVLGAVLAVHQHSAELGAVAVGIGVLRAVVLPVLVRRALEAAGELQETQPLVNVAASLLAAAVLALLAYAVTQPVVRLSPSPATQAVPVALTVLLLGFFVLVTQRRALSQLAGFLLMDNGITAVAFLTTAGVPLVVELGVSLDVLLAVLVLQVLTTRMRAV